MSGRGRKSSRGKKKVTFGDHGDAYTAPIKPSKSALVFQSTFTPKVTRRSAIEALVASNGAGSVVATVVPAVAQPEVVAVPLAIQPTIASTPTLNISLPSSRSSKASNAASGQRPRSTLTTNQMLPPSVPPTRLATHPASKSKAINKPSNRNRDLYAYSSEDAMVSEESLVLSEGSPIRLQTPVPPEDEYDQTLSDSYHEERTSNDPLSDTEELQSWAVRRPANAAKATKRKPTIAYFAFKGWMTAGSTGARKHVNFDSTMEFVDMKESVSALLGIRPSNLELVYRFSFGRDKTFRFLTTPEEWETLLEDADSYRKKPQVKAAQGHDSWTIDLKEARELAEEKSTGKKTKSSRNTAMPLAPANSADSNGTDKSSDALEMAIRSLNRELECKEHGNQYCLLPTRDIIPHLVAMKLPLVHMALVESERSEWAKDMTNHRATIWSPSAPLLSQILERIKSNRDYKHQFKAARRQGMEPETPSRFIYRSAPATMAPEVPALALNVSDEEASISPSSRSMTPSLPPIPPAALSAPAVNRPATSSTPASTISTETMLKEWLKGLDRSSRRHPKLAYESLIEIFEEEDVMTVGEMLRYSRDDLVRMDKDGLWIKLGTAQRLLDWAKQDTGR